MTAQIFSSSEIAVPKLNERQEFSTGQLEFELENAKKRTVELEIEKKRLADLNKLLSEQNADLAG